MDDNWTEVIFIMLLLGAMLAVVTVSFLDKLRACDSQIRELEMEVEELKLENASMTDAIREIQEAEHLIESEGSIDFYYRPKNNRSLRVREDKQDIGVYELTAYIATGCPCADGSYPQVGYTAASNNPSLWHRWIHIDGVGDRYVHDTGGMAVNVIDLFVGSYDEAIQFGRRTAEVYIIDR